jgi:hypothetical protein
MLPCVRVVRVSPRGQGVSFYACHGTARVYSSGISHVRHGTEFSFTWRKRFQPTKSRFRHFPVHWAVQETWMPSPKWRIWKWLVTCEADSTILCSNTISTGSMWSRVGLRDGLLRYNFVHACCANTLELKKYAGRLTLNYQHSTREIDHHLYARSPDRFGDSTFRAKASARCKFRLAFP